MAILLEGKKIDALISSIQLRAAKLDGDIHSVAIQCLMHAQEHSDPRKLDRLMNALGKAHRKEAFKLWVLAFSPIMWDGDGIVKMHKEGTQKYVPFNVEGAEAVPFWDFTVENKAKPLTLAALKKIVEALESKIDKAIEADAIGEGENVVEMKAWAVRVSQAAAA